MGSCSSMFCALSTVLVLGVQFSYGKKGKEEMEFSCQNTSFLDTNPGLD
jgi:hypothetical protein